MTILKNIADKEFIKPKLDNTTRWNSMLKMFKSIYLNKNCISKLLTSNEI